MVMNQQLFEVLFQKAGDAFFIAEADTGRIIEANHRAEILTGYDRSELIEMHQSQLHPQQMVDQYRAIFAKHARGDRMLASNLQIVRKDGSIVPVEIQGSSFEFDGRTYVFGIFRDVSDREILYRRLEQSELRNRTIAEFAPVSIVVHCNGRVVFANEQARLTLRARTTDDLRGLTVLDFVHPDDRELVRQRIRRMLTEQTAVPMLEERLKRLDGEYFHAEVYATSMEWDGMPSIMVAFHDVDDRIRQRNYREAILQVLQKSLQETETETVLQKLLRVLAERLNASSCLLAVKQEGLVVRASYQVPDALIRLVEENSLDPNSSPSSYTLINGTSLFTDSVDHLPVAEVFRRRLSDFSVKSCWSYPVRNRRGETSGSLTVFLKESRMPADEQLEALEQITYLISIFMDRSDLLDENYRLSQVVRQTREGVIITDQQRRVVYVNQAFTDVTGYTFEDVAGKNLKTILHGPATRSDTHQFMRQRLSQLKGFDCRIYNYRKNGEGFWNDLRIDPMFDRSGAHIGFIGLQRDVTEEMEAQERMQHTLEEVDAVSKARTEFLKSINHEIRTLMSSITGIAHLLNENDCKDKTSVIDILRKSADRLQILVSDILDFWQTGSVRLSFQSQVFSLQQLAGHLCESFEPLFRQSSLQFQYSIDPSIPELIGDPARIRHVYYHLLSSIQKSIEGGSIRLDIRLKDSAGSHVVIQSTLTEKNTGKSQTSIARILEPLFTADSTAMKRLIGPGLEIAKRIIEEYSGRIHISSHPDEGSKLEFDLRLEKASESAGKPVSMPDLRQARVLIVEDYEASILITRKFLELWDVQVDQAVNGEEAVHKVRNGEYDLILMDLHMPVMDGFEAARQIRMFNDRIPIIAITASNQSEVQDRIREAGMNDMILKPFHPAELSKKISAFLKNR